MTGMAVLLLVRTNCGRSRRDSIPRAAAELQAQQFGANTARGAGKGGLLRADEDAGIGPQRIAAIDRGVARQHQPELATAGARRAPVNSGARRYPVAPTRQPILRFENGAAGNGRRITQLVEERRW